MTVNPLALPDDVFEALDNQPLLAWARYYRDMGLKPVPKRIGSKSSRIEWGPYQHQAPPEEKFPEWFTEGTDGINLVMDGTGYAVIDFDGPRDKGHALLLKAGISIPDACPRAITGKDQDHFYFRTDRPLGRNIAVLKTTASRST